MIQSTEPYPMYRSATDYGWLMRPFPFDPPEQHRYTRLREWAQEFEDMAAAKAADPEGEAEMFMLDPFTKREVGT